MGTVTLLGALAFIVNWGMAVETVPPDSPDAGVIALGMLIDIVVGILIIVLYALRHRFPRVSPYAGIALAALSMLGSIAAAALVVTVAARPRSRRTAVHTGLVGVLFFAISLLELPIHPPAEDTPLREVVIVGAVITAALILLGLLVGARRQLQQARRDQAEEAEAGRLAQARAQERSRIAREMHDALGHRLSLMAVHAGALEYRRDLSPEQTGQTAGLIRENSRLALDELRDILGVLREESPAAAESPATAVSAPQPRAADIPTLLDDARAAGAVIDVEALEIDGIPDTVGRNLFRIVQELLTNARRHAPEKRLTVRVTQHDSTARLVARNDIATDAPASTTSGGYGLIGVAERVRLAGGECTMSRDAEAFEVSVVIPWQS